MTGCPARLAIVFPRSPRCDPPSLTHLWERKPTPGSLWITRCVTAPALWNTTRSAGPACGHSVPFSPCRLGERAVDSPGGLWMTGPKESAWQDLRSAGFLALGADRLHVL